MSRIDDLVRIAQKSKKPLPWYGLAMEYRSAGRIDEALATFEQVQVLDPGYVAAYFMCAQMLAERAAPGDHARALTLLDNGIAAARRTGDDHAVHEMEGLKETLA